MPQLRRQIGQLLMIGFSGHEPSAEVLDFIHEWGVGGLIFFARNLQQPENTPEILRRCAEASGKPLFVSIDQEGGLVLRLLGQHTPFPGNMALAATNDTNLARRQARAMAAEMRALGFNWNLAPVLDINHPDNPGIGARSFGADADLVARFGVEMLQGFQENGVLACAKHFPGKGEARVDSHLSLPTIPFDRQRLFAHELVPFQQAITAGVASIMTAHVFFPAFEESSNIPATLSTAVLTGLLREQLGFQGLLITDDLEMGAITEQFGVADAARRAFSAGADQILICHSLAAQRAAAQAIYDEIASSSRAHQRLAESLSRIERGKQRLAAHIFPSLSEAQLTMHAALAAEISGKAVLCARSVPSSLPLSPTGRYLFLCPELSALVQVEERHQSSSFGKQVLEYFPHSETRIYPPAGAHTEIMSVCQRGDEQSFAGIIAFSYNAHLFPGQAEALRRIATINPDSASVLVAVRNPYDVFCLPEWATALATFGFRSPSIAAALAVLSGHAAPNRGRWPINVKA